VLNSTFSGHNKIWGAPKKFWGHSPHCPRVATGLSAMQAKLKNSSAEFEHLDAFSFALRKSNSLSIQILPMDKL